MATTDPATYISDLDPAIPGQDDSMRFGDDNIREIKGSLQRTFPNVTGAMTATHTELNRAVGLTGDIQDQLDAKANHAGQEYSGDHDYTGAVIEVPTGDPFDGGAPAASQQHVSNMLALALAGGIASSTTSLTMAVADHALVCEEDKAFTGGLPARLYNAATGYYMDGLIKSYDTATGAMVFTGQTLSGAGTLAQWSISIGTRTNISDASRAYYYN